MRGKPNIVSSCMWIQASFWLCSLNMSDFWFEENTVFCWMKKFQDNNIWAGTEKSVVIVKEINNVTEKKPADCTRKTEKA